MERANRKSTNVSRDIIDIILLMKIQSSNDNDDLKINKLKQKKDKENSSIDQEKDDDTNNEVDEFNVSLAKMEEEIKPKILTILIFKENYFKLQKYQLEKLNAN